MVRTTEHPSGWWPVLTGLFLVATSVGCAPSAPGQGPGGSDLRLISGRGLRLVIRLDPSLGGILDNASTYVTGDRHHEVYRLSALRRARTVATYTSFARFRRRVQAGGPGRRVRAVMYDPEAWPLTPRREQTFPAEYMARFSRLARSHGYDVILAPSPNLTDIPAGGCHLGPRESRTGAYLRCGIARDAGRWADLLDVQAQALERDARAYRSFVETAARQARGANPAVQIVAQVSTAPADRAVSAATMLHASTSVAGVVNGFYVFVDPTNVSAGASFVRRSTSARPS